MLCRSTERARDGGDGGGGGEKWRGVLGCQAHDHDHGTWLPGS